MMNCLIDIVISVIFAISTSLMYNYLDLFPGQSSEMEALEFFGSIVIAWFFIIEWRIDELGSRELR